MKESFLQGRFITAAGAMIALLLVSGCRCGNQCYVTEWRSFDYAEITQHDGHIGRPADTSETRR